MLRWTPAPDGGLMERFPREEMRFDVHGRRLKSGGVLSGALHTLGYVRAEKTEHGTRRNRDRCVR